MSQTRSEEAQQFQDGWQRLARALRVQLRPRRRPVRGPYRTPGPRVDEQREPVAKKPDSAADMLSAQTFDPPQSYGGAAVLVGLVVALLGLLVLVDPGTQGGVSPAAAGMEP